MQCDRPLSAIVPGFTVRIAHLFQDGDERLMQCDRPLSAIVPGFTVRIAHLFQDGDERLMQYDRPLSAIVPGSCSARPSLPGWRRASLMQHDWPLGGIMSSPPSAPPMPSRMGDPSYAARLPLGADMPGSSMRATTSITSCIPSLIHCTHTLHAFMHSSIIPHTFIHTHVHRVLPVPRRRFIYAWTSKLLRWKARVRVLYSRLMHSGGRARGGAPFARPRREGGGVPHRQITFRSADTHSYIMIM
ncbi:unnamed protein product [Cuscuta epithymum]|uniref:Uncharacterized protein n=1 Tax=Cuscuta epithymum TaxID=186058 RepID=A0AAV0DPI6_9ASTE|nr:unnamed protein product [Cuscuta epithymum]